MKIAIATENGKTVSRHFGCATRYIVVNTENGKILSRETRPKVEHLHSDCTERKRGACECQNQSSEASVYDRHRTMILNILDCSILLAGGMGWGVYETLKSRGIKAVIAEPGNVEEVVTSYLNTNFQNNGSP